jgi:hypothetical protein
MLLVPADVLRPRRPDEHFAAEAAAADEAGVPVALVDHDGLTRAGGADRAVAAVPAGGPALYRGWMLRTEQYRAFGTALATRGVRLVTTVEQYQRAHELPGWYPTLAPLTPRSVWTAGDDRAAFDLAREELGGGPAVLRDYVKSMKHYWDLAVFIPDLSDAEAAWRVASRFRQLRAEDFVGGFVLRQFEHFSTAEARTWWIDGTCALVGPHPDTPSDHPPAELDLTPVAALITTLDLPFVTVDLARRTDGQWRVIELGDGQVSDRPPAITADALIAALHHGR